METLINISFVLIMSGFVGGAIVALENSKFVAFVATKIF